MWRELNGFKSDMNEMLRGITLNISPEILNKHIENIFYNI
jgi:hypothetical protein